MSKFSPYTYQEGVAQHVLDGKNVILQAPTGAGKTTAALLPFLHARQTLVADRFPRKCIYSVPMRVLAGQFKAEYQKRIRQYGWQHSLDVTIQTGDRPDDPKAEGDLIFTTIDQTLSNFLNIPYALGSRSANLNAGAIVSSYLVFDEMHLYDPNTSLPTTLEMLRMLRGVTPFIIMTATYSSSMLKRLAKLVDAVVVPEDDDSRTGMQKIGSQVGKVRRFHAVDEPLTASHVVEQDRAARRKICICNTVRSAQQLYLDLQAKLQARGDTETKLCLLHSRFYKADRDDKEEWVREQFGIPQAEYHGPPLILVATQVIEVGVDATCDILFTELAPAASILQRAGRCARRAHETGDVYIHLPRTDEGEPDFAPYYLPSQAKQTDRGRRLCEATWAAINSQVFQGQHMSFDREQALIDQVHTPIDQEILDGMSDRRYEHQKRILYTMQQLDKSAASELIRDVNNRFVVVHPNPDTDEHLQRNPWYYDGFSLFPGTIARAFYELQEDLPDELPWMMQSAYRLEDKSTQEQENPSRQPPEYRWVALQNGSEVYQSAVIALHPSIARYSKEVGFEFGLSDETQILRKRPGKPRTESYSYRRETYAEHVEGLYRAYRYALPDRTHGRMRLALADEIACVVRRLENSPAFKLAPGQLDELLRALFACHDLGKLNVQWQTWAHKWQQRVGRFYDDVDMSLPPEYMAAHTDFDPTDAQKEAQKKLGKRPPHAGESAMAAGHLLHTVCQGDTTLWCAAMTAIARHHHAATGSHKPYKSHRFARQAFEEALAVVNLAPELANQVTWTVCNMDGLSKYLVPYDSRGVKGLLLYLLLIRVLRLADQRSQIK